MKLLAITALTMGLVATPILAKDIGPDKAMQLVESGAIKPFTELNDIARALHPGAEVTETELEHKKQGYIYEVELRDETNRKWEVELDAETAKVLHDREESDN